MLKSLYITNYALIDELSIDFAAGFNVFTGETGAGKSIIIGALAMLLKGRSDPSIIKSGKDKATIEGIFVTEDKELINILEDNDIDCDGEIIIRRTIGKDRSSIRINGVAVTLGFVSDLSVRLLDIHSQRDSIYLLDNRKQLALLDRFANSDLSAYKVAYQKLQTARAEYEHVLNEELSERELEYLQYDLQELIDADLKAGEEEQLSQLELAYNNASRYQQAFAQALELYKGDGGIKEKFYDLLNALAPIETKEIIESKALLDDLYYNLEDVLERIEGFASAFQEDAIDIEKIQERLFTYAKLKRKHKTDTEGLLALRAELAAKLARFEQRDDIIANKRIAFEEAQAVAQRLADELSALRRAKALELRDLVLAQTADLMLKNCSFMIAFNKKELQADGQDDIEFQVAMNIGEPLKSLKNTASGGEISRLMLAIKTVFAAYQHLEMMVFDEIDTGVSGKVASAVGRKMQEIAKHTQVLCITHLAPVAACGSTHFYIYKSSDDTSTRTDVKVLNEAERLEELAQMASGSLSNESLAAAKELLLISSMNN